MGSAHRRAVGKSKTNGEKKKSNNREEEMDWTRLGTSYRITRQQLLTWSFLWKVRQAA